MTTQPELFAQQYRRPGVTELVPYVPHVAGSATSRAAAKAVWSTAKTKREMVFACIQASGDWGMTDDEVQVALGMPGHTQCPRRKDLSDAGLIEVCGHRLTRAGNPACVWRVKA